MKSLDARLIKVELGEKCDVRAGLPAHAKPLLNDILKTMGGDKLALAHEAALRRKTEGGKQKDDNADDDDDDGWKDDDESSAAVESKISDLHLSLKERNKMAKAL